MDENNIPPASPSVKSQPPEVLLQPSFKKRKHYWIPILVPTILLCIITVIASRLPSGRNGTLASDLASPLIPAGVSEHYFYPNWNENEPPKGQGGFVYDGTVSTVSDKSLYLGYFYLAGKKIYVTKSPVWPRPVFMGHLEKTKLSPDTFEYLMFGDTPSLFFARDRKYVYGGAAELDLSPEDVRLLSNTYATDGEKVYFRSDLVPVVDADKVQIVKEGYDYLTDGSHVYYRGVILPEVNPAAFIWDPEQEVFLSGDFVVIGGRVLPYTSTEVRGSYAGAVYVRVGDTLYFHDYKEEWLIPGERGSQEETFRFGQDFVALELDPGDYVFPDLLFYDVVHIGKHHCYRMYNRATTTDARCGPRKPTAVLSNWETRDYGTEALTKAGRQKITNDYYSDGRHVYYMGVLQLPDADVTSFRQFSRGLNQIGVDRYHVYDRAEIIPGADPATFAEYRYSSFLFRDANTLFCSCFGVGDYKLSRYITPVEFDQGFSFSDVENLVSFPPKATYPEEFIELREDGRYYYVGLQN